MRRIMAVGLIISLSLFSLAMLGQEETKTKKKDASLVSFKKQVFPIIQKHCLPCHAEENFNPSELSLDSYELMKDGGKHGEPWKPGKSGESLLAQKLTEEPPFGDRMPLNTKKDIKAGKAKWLSPEDIKVITNWIDQGAKNN